MTKQDHPMSIAGSIGIMAYSEEANIGLGVGLVGHTAPSTTRKSRLAF
jgi:hypothetical protein